MLCVFLPALNFRGNRSPYLWWFYKFVHAFGNEACYVCGDEYYADPAWHLIHERDEASGRQALRLGYEIPDLEVLAGLARYDLPAQLWRSLEDRFPSNPVRSFEHFCLQEDAGLSDAFSGLFDRIELRSGALEAVITCVNCATLRSLCRKRGIPLIHIELGPLRSPFFIPTAYFDFSGANGQTESRARFEAAKDCIQTDEWHSVEALRSLLMTSHVPEHGSPDIDLGLALQIEDDSNIICYSNGFSSSSLINNAQISLAQREIGAPVLVRTHPGSFFGARDRSPGLLVDRSESAIGFILRCRRIHTINSSVAVEAMLLGREAVVFGESPFTFCIDPRTRRADARALAFFLLNYLVPWNAAFSSEYVRWRLTMPPEEIIRETHLEQFMQEKINHIESRMRELETQISELGGALAKEKEQIALLRSSFSWRLERAVRSLYRTIIGGRSRR